MDKPEKQTLSINITYGDTTSTEGHIVLPELLVLVVLFVSRAIYEDGLALATSSFVCYVAFTLHCTCVRALLPQYNWARTQVR